MTTCRVCGERGWLIVDVDSTGRLRIERCDECQRLTDDEARILPDAQAELARIEHEGGKVWREL